MASVLSLTLSDAVTRGGNFGRSYDADYFPNLRRRKLMKSYREPFPKVSGGSGTRKVLLILFTKQFELPARRSTSRIISPAAGSSSFTETRLH